MPNCFAPYDGSACTCGNCYAPVDNELELDGELLAFEEMVNDRLEYELS